MPKIHKYGTVSFRPSDWERVQIEERAAMSGLHKKDFIARSCIYSNICVVGSRDNIQRIVNAVEEMRNVMGELASSISAGSFPLSADAFQDMSMHYTALCLTLVEILNGAAYLFEKEVPSAALEVDKRERLSQFLETIGIDYNAGDKDAEWGRFGDGKNDREDTKDKNG